ncbi:MAG: FtsW/RodA/SpoVE family cell cycle protein [Bacteroidales bacterium]|nr:FtsW/RodA/SpoVE family cell cycle protein [Bacteroidales bacterium]
MGKRAKQLVLGDRTIWVLVVLLSLVSLVEVYSSIGKAAYDHGWNIWATVFKHVVIVALSYVIMIAISHVPFKWFSSLSRLGFWLCFGMMALMFVIALSGKITGSSSGHAASRWLDDIPVIGQFQPSEIAKFVLIIFLARQISKYRESLKEWSTFKSLMFPVVAISAFIFPENFSTAALVFLSCMVLMYVGGVNKKYLLWTMLFVVLAVGAFLLCSFVFELSVFRSETWVNRINDWLNSDKDAITQTNIAKIAIASGGLTGNGPGNTVQGRFLNESHTDFIYSVITEELGLIVVLAIIAIYIIFFVRCMSVSRNCDSFFGQLTVAGLGFLITLQAMVNMGVATGYLPVTGQTLPLVSYGGTSYVLTCSAIGVILAVSSHNKKRQLANKQAEQTEQTEQTETNIESQNESNN